MTPNGAVGTMKQQECNTPENSYIPFFLYIYIIWKQQPSSVVIAPELQSLLLEIINLIFNVRTSTVFDKEKCLVVYETQDVQKA